MAAIRFGRIRAFDEDLYTASVEITGYQATMLEDVPVAFHLREDLVTAGTRCLVVLNEGMDSSDAVVVALFGGAPEEE